MFQEGLLWGLTLVFVYKQQDVYNLRDIEKFSTKAGIGKKIR